MRKKAPAKAPAKKRATKKRAVKKPVVKRGVSSKDIEAEEYDSAYQYSRIIRTMEKHGRDLSKIQEILKNLNHVQELVKNIFKLQDSVENTLHRLNQSESLAVYVGDAVLLSLFNMAAMKEMPEEEKNKLLMDNIVKAIRRYKHPDPIPSSIREGLLETVAGVMDV